MRISFYFSAKDTNFQKKWIQMAGKWQKKNRLPEDSLFNL